MATHYPTLDELKKFAVEREHRGLSLNCPHLVKLNNGSLHTYPGDDLHNSHPNAVHTMSDMTAEDAFTGSIKLNRGEPLNGSEVE